MNKEENDHNIYNENILVEEATIFSKEIIRLNNKKKYVLIFGIIISFFSSIPFFLLKIIDENQNDIIKIDLVSITIVLIIYWSYESKTEKISKQILKIKNEIKKIKLLKYKTALKENDKQLALELGRDYYSFNRGGHLSIYDESAISNDIASMK